MRKKALLLAVIFVIILGFGACAAQQKDTSVSRTGSSSATETSSPWIGLEGVQNARRLSGYLTHSNGTVNPGLILRSGELAGLTDPGKALLAGEYRLTHIIDLRDEIEVAAAPDPAIKGTQYHHLNVWPRAVRLRLIEESTVNGLIDSELYKEKYYTAFALEPTAITAYRSMFDILLDNEDGTVLIHCMHGRDRTGIAITLILSALDVGWDSVEQEYLLSNVAIAGSVEVSSLRLYREIIEKNYGSMENYLKEEMGLNENRLLTLRGKYTTS